MITYRLRGLVSLYVVTSTLFVAFFFLLCAAAYDAVFNNLIVGFGLRIYFLGVVAGMVASARSIASVGPSFHRLTKHAAAWLAFRQVSMVALVTFTIIVASKELTISRVFMASFLPLLWVVLIFVNMALPRALARLAFNKTHLIPSLFIGKSETLAKLTDWIANKHELGIHPAGFLSDDADGADRARQVGAARWLGPTSELPSILEEKGIGQVILLDFPTRRGEIDAVVESCQAAGCRLLIYNNLEERVPLPLLPVVEEGHLFFTTQDEPLEDPMNRTTKRIFDIAVSLPVVLFILPPLSIWVWLAQRIQAPGPLMFVRQRGGQKRTEFLMLKYRSMYDASPDAQREAQQAQKDDDRVYPFGHFLRRTSLDEFPQFLNVLKGDMSIVGPRPHLPSHDVEFSRIAKTYRSRKLVKPGITGLAQTSGFRGEISDPQMLQRRVELDIYYITHWTIWLDVDITLRTLRHVILPPKTAF